MILALVALLSVVSWSLGWRFLALIRRILDAELRAEQAEAEKEAEKRLRIKAEERLQLAEAELSEAKTAFVDEKGRHAEAADRAADLNLEVVDLRHRLKAAEAAQAARLVYIPSISAPAAAPPPESAWTITWTTTFTE
jgi:hypothetical protein